MDERKAYWQEVEREIGERVLSCTLGKLLTPLGGIPVPSYCLLFLTPSRLFIRYLPPERKILSLPLGGERGREQTISFLRSSILRVNASVPSVPLIQRIFHSPVTVLVQVEGSEGGVMEIRCLVEHDPHGFIEELESSLLS